MKADKYIKNIIEQALKEDAVTQDVTTKILIPKDKVSNACIVIKENAVICGLEIVKALFKKLDPNIHFHNLYKDGDYVSKKSKIAILKGKTRALLAGERAALNFLSYLSGIATKTNRFVQEIKPYSIQVVDTRKTTPGLRLLGKKAVLCGKGINHRSNLSEMVLIKDNHIVASEMPLNKIVSHVKKSTHKAIGIEVDTLKQFKQVMETDPDFIILDNMNPREIKKAVELNKRKKCKKKPKLEASGGINIKNIQSFAKTGVDRISLGELTHTIKAVDITMEIIDE